MFTTFASSSVQHIALSFSSRISNSHHHAMPDLPCLSMISTLINIYPVSLVWEHSKTFVKMHYSRLYCLWRWLASWVGTISYSQFSQISFGHPSFFMVHSSYSSHLFKRLIYTRQRFSACLQNSERLLINSRKSIIFILQRNGFNIAACING